MTRTSSALTRRTWRAKRSAGRRREAGPPKGWIRPRRAGLFQWGTSLMLFESKERIRTTPKKPGEDDFSFYDSAARPEFEVYRQLVNGWVEELPEADRAETIARLRKNDSLGYQAALAELTIHASLVLRGYDVEIHPSCAHPTRKPDFLAKDVDGNPVAYVEVTTFGPAQEHVARINREATIYNAIDKVKLPPGFRLSYDVEVYGHSNPNVGKLCKDIAAWAEASQQDDPEVTPTKVFEADDWKIEIGLIGGFKLDAPVEHAIGGAMGDVRVVSAETKIKEALKKKGSRYGKFVAPYVIVVVDCSDELTGGDRNAESLIDAVFGTIVTEVITYDSGERVIADKRLDDGYFGSPETPRHQNVSGAVLLPKPHLWDLRTERWQPLLATNPWAAHPLPPDFLPLPGYAYLVERDEFEKVDGTRLADILGLPDVWPPEED
ncbi:hypothetical protein [Terrihabitans sp. B22-R8]|uniref:hypothetical protein n=1 Tax=Terrihabitans sp. B22-R8 TaxID=3425128 RepID=UPI00403CE16D